MRAIASILGIVVLLIVWGAWADNSYLAVDMFVSEAKTERLTRAGAWGDSFGALNALVSAAGFAVVVMTLATQRRAIKDQADDLHRQRFESSFFELMRLMRELRSQLTYDYSEDLLRRSGGHLGSVGRTYADHDAIAALLNEILAWLPSTKSEDSAALKREIVKTYNKRVYGVSESKFSPYFRLIYTILYRCLEDRVLNEEEKSRYTNLLRSQLTSQELSVLAINALTPHAKDLQSMLERARMLKYLPRHGTVRMHLEAIYSPVAFEARS